MTPFDQVRTITRSIPPSELIREIVPQVHGRASLLLVICAWQDGSQAEWAEALDIHDRTLDGFCGAILATLHEHGHTIIHLNTKGNQQ